MSQARKEFTAGLNAKLESLPSRTGGVVFDGIREYVLGQVDKAVHDLGGVENVKAKCREAYDRFVKPIDFPYVPEFVESMLDAQLKEMLDSFVESAHETAHKDEPAPAPLPTPANPAGSAQVE